MALQEAVETVQGHAADLWRDFDRVDLRREFDRLHEALERREHAALGAAEDALDKAEAAITSDRRRAPIVVVTVGVALVGVAAVIVWRRRRRGDDDANMA
jgi:hypothetical protein